MTAAAMGTSDAEESRRWFETRPRAWVWIVGLAAATILGSVVLSSVGAFPENWNIGLAEPINDARGWLIANQRTHSLYTFILNPIADVIDGAVSMLETILEWIPWYSYLGFAGLGLWWTRGRVAGLLGVVGVSYFGFLEVWDDGLVTLALMSVAVLCCMLIGIPLGVLSSRNETAQRVLRPVLDAMQTMPGFVYLIPFVLLFSVGIVPALVSTLIFALPPVVRATDIGIRELPASVVEAADMFGATERQTLLKVRLPLARPAILVGVNQSINLALSMVVIAALIGAGGLGGLVLTALRNLNVGEAAEAGIAIVLMAILLDRFFSGLADPGSRHESGLISKLALALCAITVVGGLFGSRSFPTAASWHFEDPINRAVGWAQVNLFDIGDSGIGTGPFSDFFTLRLITPLRELLSMHIPWPVMIAVVAVAGFALAGWKLAFGLAAGLFSIGLLGMWELSMDTLAQCLVAVAMTLLIGIPLGIVSARSDTTRTVLRPILDFLQTIPSFVLLVPVIMLFNVGRVPGILASVVYALPVAINYTDLGLRQVPASTREAAVTFGATSRQRLSKVELPLAAPQIVTAVNQTVMLVLAMVVIAGLVGGGGLGLETVRALRRSDSVGTGFEAGLAIVALAGILDRLARSVAQRLRPPTALN